VLPAAVGTVDELAVQLSFGLRHFFSDIALDVGRRGGGIGAQPCDALPHFVQLVTNVPDVVLDVPDTRLDIGCKPRETNFERVTLGFASFEFTAAVFEFDLEAGQLELVGGWSAKEF
jgi:hypothetical protein